MKEFKTNYRYWNLVAVLGASLALLFNIRSLLSGQISNITSFFSYFIYEFVCISPWIIAVVILEHTRKYFYSNKSIKVASFHVVFASILFLIHSSTQTFANSIFFENVNFNLVSLEEDFIYFFDVRVLIYVGLLIAFGYIQYYSKKKELILHKHQLQTELEKAKLTSIINGVQPKFLIENINELIKLINERENFASQYLINLSDLLRLFIRHSKNLKISVNDDIAIYQCYVRLISRKVESNIEFSSSIDESLKDIQLPKTYFIIPYIDKIFQYLRKTNKRVPDKINYELKSASSSIVLTIKISKLDHIQEDLILTIKNKLQNDLYDQYQTSVNTILPNVYKSASCIFISLQIKIEKVDEELYYRLDN